jgi:hypothetical protein
MKVDAKLAELVPLTH